MDWNVFDQTKEGIPYFVMELVPGEKFDQVLIREWKIEPERAARLLLQVVDALRAAHHLSESESILHLDLKPDNLFLIPGQRGREERMKVIDFGIGQYIGDEEVQHEGGEVLPSADGDGLLDLASANFDAGNVTLFFQTSPGRFPTIPSVILEDPGIPRFVTTADLNSDGQVDILSADGSDHMSVYFAK